MLPKIYLIFFVGKFAKFKIRFFSSSSLLSVTTRRISSDQTHVGPVQPGSVPFALVLGQDVRELAVGELKAGPGGAQFGEVVPAVGGGELLVADDVLVGNGRVHLQEISEAVEMVQGGEVRLGLDLGGEVQALPEAHHVAIGFVVEALGLGGARDVGGGGAARDLAGVGRVRVVGSELGVFVFFGPHGAGVEVDAVGGGGRGRGHRVVAQGVGVQVPPGRGLQDLVGVPAVVLAPVFLPRSVLVIGILLHVEQPQLLGPVDERLPLLLRQLLPPPTQALGDLRVVDVGLDVDDSPPLDLRPDHEGVHRALDVVRRMLFGLKKKLN